MSLQEAKGNLRFQKSFVKTTMACCLVSALAGAMRASSKIDESNAFWRKCLSEFLEPSSGFTTRELFAMAQAFCAKGAMIASANKRDGSVVTPSFTSRSSRCFDSQMNCCNLWHASPGL